MKKILLGILGILTGVSIVLLLFMLFIYGHLDDANLGAPIPEKHIEEREVSTPFSAPDWKSEEEDQEQTETVTESVSGESISVLLGGDVNLSRFEEGYQSKGITYMMSQEYTDIMKNADFTMVNQEFPFSTRGEAMPDKTYTFREDPSLVSVIHDMGIDMVSLANNHILDYGRDALEDTLVTLEQAQIPYGGAGRNLEEAKALRIFEIKGRKLGILCASRVIPVSDWNASSNTSGVFTTYEPAALKAAIAEAKTKCDLVLVYVHWGIERNPLPEDYQKNLAKQYIDNGADMVIGAHPHIWQGLEFYKGKPIAYSLGNLIFSNTSETALLRIDIDGENNMKLTVLPLIRSGSALVTHTNRQQFFKNLQDISFGIEIGEDGVVSEVVQSEEE